VRFSTNLAKTQKFIEAIKNDENERRNFAIPDNKIVIKDMLPQLWG